MTNDTAHRERSTDLGVVRINNEVVATIASVAAMEVKGVYKMGGGIKKALHEVFLRRSSQGSVRICSKDSEIKLTVSIIVDYGVDIPRVADEVQENVKQAVEKMTGLIMSEVDVVVDGVHAPGENDRQIRRTATL